MLAKTTGFTVRGIDGHAVEIEVDLSGGLPAYTTVGLPDTAVRESRERIVSALRNSGFDFPSRRITVNLAPAEMKKEGTQLDLPIAVGILAASGQLEARQPLDRVGLIGELALDGTLRGVWGVLPMALRAAQAGLKALIVPSDNAAEAAAVPMRVLPARNLRQVLDHLSGHATLEAIVAVPPGPEPAQTSSDLSDVRGQVLAKRALEIAAAGGHNLILVGPPGTGKSMLARRLPGLLPPLSTEEALETARIHSVSGLLPPQAGLPRERPFRSPHHTVSDVALVGGSNPPRPGEISLAHNGVLFLDELPEFHRDALEALENGKVCVARAGGSVSFPARFLLAAAMNPCPCGYQGHPSRPCMCTPVQIRKYRSKVSGPLWDRIDLQVEMNPITFSEFASAPNGTEESSAAVRERVLRARALQTARLRGTRSSCNARMTVRQVRAHCQLDPEGNAILEKAMDRLGLSARSLDRILRVARTIADLEGAQSLRKDHLAEAIQFRALDRPPAG